MTGEKKRRSFVHHDLVKHHHCPSHQKDRTATASLHPRYQPRLFRERACPLFGGGIDSLRHHGGGGDLANCECGRIHKALPIVTCLDNSSGDQLLPIAGCPFVMSSAVETSLIEQEHGPVACAPSGFRTRCGIYLPRPHSLRTAECNSAGRTGRNACVPGRTHFARNMASSFTYERAEYDE